MYLLDALQPRPVLQPRVLEGPRSRAGEGVFLPRLPRHPPVILPEADADRDEPLAEVPRLVRVAQDGAGGLPDPPESGDDDEREPERAEHRPGGDQRPEPPPRLRRQLVAGDQKGVGRLQREGRQEGQDQVVPERQTVGYLLLPGGLGPEESFEALHPPQEPGARPGEEEQVGEHLQPVAPEHEEDQEAYRQGPDAAAGEREVEGDEKGEHEDRVEPAQGEVAQRGHPGQREYDPHRQDHGGRVDVP